jgi:hypothetical protein
MNGEVINSTQSLKAHFDYNYKHNITALNRPTQVPAARQAGGGVATAFSLVVYYASYFLLQKRAIFTNNKPQQQRAGGHTPFANSFVN